MKAFYLFIQPVTHIFYHGVFGYNRVIMNNHVNVSLLFKVHFNLVNDIMTFDDICFRRHFYMGGHLNAAGYQLTAWQVMTYIDWIIRNRPEDFTQVAFIGRGGVHHCNHVW